MIVLFHVGTMTKREDLAYHIVNYDSSIFRQVTMHGNRTTVHTIPKMPTQIGLSKENNLILKDYQNRMDGMSVMHS